jgi:FKBP-type peptidyl-prolyl cis-trans isomerase (trigger factor)
MHKRSQALQSIQAVLENWQGFDAPSSMVTECERDAMRRSRQYLQQQYGNSETFKSSLAQMKQEAAEAGARKARCRALLLRWARTHGVALVPEELDAVLRGRAARQNKSPEEYLLSAARTGEVFGVQAAMLEEKALYALFDTIRNTEKAAG